MLDTDYFVAQHDLNLPCLRPPPSIANTKNLMHFVGLLSLHFPAWLGPFWTARTITKLRDGASLVLIRAEPSSCIDPSRA